MEYNFIEYVQKYPKQYAIAKSKLCINLLSFLSKSGATIKEILASDSFHRIELADLELLLNMLVSIKLLNKTKINNKEIYYAGEFTNLFLEEYKSTKKNYDI